MKRFYAVVSVLGLLTLASCTKEQGSGSDNKVSSINDITVPAGFTWENSRDVNFDISVGNAAVGTYVVSIYDIDPALGGKLLTKGAATATSNFKAKVYLANTVKEVFVVKTSPNNVSTSQKVSVTTPSISLTMSTAGSADAGGIKVKGIGDSPSCTTGCTMTVTASNTNLNPGNGDVICVTGSNITIGFNAQSGATIRICGSNVTLQNANLNDGATLIVTSSGSINFSNINLNGSNSQFTNYGTVSVNGSFSPGGKFLNENTINVTGDFNMNSQSTFTNNGAITVGSSMNINTTNLSTNNGSIIANNDFTLNSGSTFVNNCKIWAKNNYNNNALMKNYSLINVNNSTTINSSTELGLYAGGMLKTKDLMLNGAIKGYTSTGLAKVAGNTTINSSGSITGTVQICDANGIETNYGTIGSGATQACDVYIPVSNCNTEGNGSAPAVDTDGDGVNDELDEYPTDPTKAFNNYYPSSKATDFATSAFEDQWPNKGDYDLNDVVMAYRYKIVTNASNRVVQLVGDYTLRATGGGQQNGFGVEFPINASLVSKISGASLETGHTKAVVILFSNMRNEMLNWNTRPSEAVTTPKAYSITMDINSGPTLTDFGLSEYNPFTWNGALGRKYEIHLMGKTPTAVADTKMFGTSDDNSSVAGGKYYVSKTGLPWGISIPTGTFDYPSETIEITQAYLKFKDWAESGATLFTDWYSSSSGYRDATKIYAPK